MPVARSAEVQKYASREVARAYDDSVCVSPPSVPSYSVVSAPAAIVTGASAITAGAIKAPAFGSSFLRSILKARAAGIIYIFVI